MKSWGAAGGTPYDSGVPNGRFSLDVLYERFVDPFWQQMIHWEFATLDDEHRTEWFGQLREAAGAIDTTSVHRLLTTNDWRAQVTGAWFGALTDLEGVVERIEALLMTPNHPSGPLIEGLSMALALRPSRPARELLDRFCWRHSGLEFRELHGAPAVLQWMSKRVGAEPRELVDLQIARAMAAVEVLEREGLIADVDLDTAAERRRRRLAARREQLNESRDDG